MNLQSLESIIRDYAAPSITIMRPINMDAVMLTIGWHDCIYTTNIKHILDDAVDEDGISIDGIKRVVALGIRGIADAIKEGICAHCGRRKTVTGCEECQHDRLDPA